MQSYQHTQIARLIDELDKKPGSDADYSSWVLAPKHLEFLKRNRQDDEVILYASGPCTFIHAVITKEADLTTIDYDDLLDWGSGPFIGRASYAGYPGSDQVSLEPGEPLTKPTSMRHRQNLVFARQMDQDSGDDPVYYELLQEFTHATGIHWRPEQHAYCQIGQNGNIEPIVSITERGDTSSLVLVTCKRQPLEQYIAASGYILVQFFEFSMVDYQTFRGWRRDGRQQQIVESDDFMYTRLTAPPANARTRGLQIQQLSDSKSEILRSIFHEFPEPMHREYASFQAIDQRDGRIKSISTDPQLTANYFNAHTNSLPLETSPAFFNAEVLSKYKADRDKYTVHERNRRISCRGSWSLKLYDTNEAGQIHAYICYLAQLPHTEQLHWLQFNEQPFGSISERALERDIKGHWSSHQTPLEAVLEIAESWSQADHSWWNIRDRSLLSRITTPVAENRDEWSRSFLDLSTLIIQNFNTKAISEILTTQGISHAKGERSIKLAERLIAAQQTTNEQAALTGLRTAQLIRSKIAAHDGGKEARNIADQATLDHGTYKAHFEHVCDQITNDLRQIQDAFTAARTPPTRPA